jgi:hypothetical protein
MRVPLDGDIEQGPCRAGDGGHRIDHSLRSASGGAAGASASLSPRGVVMAVGMAAGICAAAIGMVIALRGARRIRMGARRLEPGRAPSVRISLTSDPPGALVYRTGVDAALGRTPLTFRTPRSDQPMGLVLRFPAGRIQRVRAVPRRSLRLHVRTRARSAAVPDGEPRGT